MKTEQLIFSVSGPCPCCGAELSSLHVLTNHAPFDVYFFHEGDRLGDASLEELENMHLCGVSNGEKVRRNYLFLGEHVGATTYETVQTEDLGTWKISIVKATKVGCKPTYSAQLTSQYKRKRNQNYILELDENGGFVSISWRIPLEVRRTAHSILSSYHKH